MAFIFLWLTLFWGDSMVCHASCVSSGYCWMVWLIELNLASSSNSRLHLWWNFKCELSLLSWIFLCTYSKVCLKCDCLIISSMLLWLILSDCGIDNNILIIITISYHIYVGVRACLYSRTPCKINIAFGMCNFPQRLDHAPLIPYDL